MRIRGDIVPDESGMGSAQDEKIFYIVQPNVDIEEMGIHDV